jgi:hypothetical protein
MTARDLERGIGAAGIDDQDFIGKADALQAGFDPGGGVAGDDDNGKRKPFRCARSSCPKMSAGASCDICSAMTLFYAKIFACDY